MRQEVVSTKLSLLTVLALIGVMLVAALVAPATAEARTAVETGKAGDNAKYTLYDDGFLDITGSGAITKKFSDYASQIKTVSIPEGITSIGYGCFENCALTSLTLPSTVKSLGDYSFYQNKQLKEVIVRGNPSSLVKIGFGAFGECSKLESVSWKTESASEVRLGGSAFSDCTSLNSFNIPLGLVDATSGTFYRCPFIKAFDRCGDYSSDYQGYSAFYAVLSDNTLVISGHGDIENYSSPTKVPWEKYASSINKVVISDQITGIGDNAFYKCSKVSSIDIPKPVTRIGDYAFALSGVKNVNFQENGKIEEIADTAFDGTPNGLLIDCAWNGAPAQYSEDYGYRGINKPTSIEDAVVTVESPTDRVWTGKEIKPKVSVTLSGKQLIEGQDYSVRYKNNVDAGSATVIVDGEGHYWKSAEGTFNIVPPSITYRTHVQREGWQGWKKDGQSSGTSGKSLRLEGINIKAASSVSGDIEYRTHVQTYGWQDWKKNGAMSGTSGESKRLEAIQIQLTGDMAEQFDIYYRVHAQIFGWMGWAKNGEKAGTAGYSFRLEAIQIKLVKKGDPAPGSTKNCYKSINIPNEYKKYIAQGGWGDGYFDIVDINKDSTPELLVSTDKAMWVYTYDKKNGKYVKLIKSAPNGYAYRIYYNTKYHEVGLYSEQNDRETFAVYKISASKATKKMTGERRFFVSNGYWINGKKVSSSTYSKKYRSYNYLWSSDYVTNGQ